MSCQTRDQDRLAAGQTQGKSELTHSPVACLANFSVIGANSGLHGRPLVIGARARVPPVEGLEASRILVGFSGGSG
ncbi:MAG: hypothetical protein AAF442_04850 [Pseudomonadota bacterium]